MEPVINEQIVEWIRRVKSDWISVPARAKSFDIGKRIQFLTVDIITEICLGTALGCVASDSDKYEFLETVEKSSSFNQQFSVLLELNSLIRYVTKIPVLGNRLLPQASDKSGVGRIMGVSLPTKGPNSWLIPSKIVRSALVQPHEGASRKDLGMLGSFIDRNVLRVDAEMLITL